jgi:hypothetical protein
VRLRTLKSQKRRCVYDVKNSFHIKQNMWPTPSIESKEKVKESKRKWMENKNVVRLTGAGSKM